MITINNKNYDVEKFAFDGCHKIYLLENDDQEKEAINKGFQVLDIEDLPEIWDKSCPLRFINFWDIKKESPVPQDRNFDVDFNIYNLPKKELKEIESICSEYYDVEIDDERYTNCFVVSVGSHSISLKRWDGQKLEKIKSFLKENAQLKVDYLADNFKLEELEKAKKIILKRLGF